MCDKKYTNYINYNYYASLNDGFSTVCLISFLGGAGGSRNKRNEFPFLSDVELLTLSLIWARL